MKLKVLSIIVTVFAVILFSYQCSSGPDKEKIHKQLTLEVDEINKNVPTMLSETIRLDSVVLRPNNDLENNYTVTDTISDKSSFFGSIRDEAKRVTKDDPGMADIRSYKISTVYNYRDNDGNMLYSFTITPQDYQ
ncbi:MAG: hypothetical protein E6772_13910 [Dysgonomonas sp.]|nr:hypothetical protein [Dysgonomonas sp.]